MDRNSNPSSTAYVRIFMIPLGSVGIMGIAANAEPANGAGERALTSAVYLKHIGDSDKPILPVVISATKPSEPELKAVLGKNDSKHAILVSVTRDDLRRIMAELNKLLAPMKDEPKGHTYGTFCVTITETESDPQRILPEGTTRIQRTLRLKEILPVLVAIEKVERASRTRNERLRTVVASLKRRLSGEETP